MGTKNCSSTASLQKKLLVTLIFKSAQSACSQIFTSVDVSDDFRQRICTWFDSLKRKVLYRLCPSALTVNGVYFERLEHLFYIKVKCRQKYLGQKRGNGTGTDLSMFTGLCTTALTDLYVRLNWFCG